MKHATRIEAEKNFSAASKAVREYTGTDERLYAELEANFATARDALIAAEVAHPTHRETSRRSNRLRLENMGLLT